jgi:hypothetical protein
MIDHIQQVRQSSDPELPECGVGIMAQELGSLDGLTDRGGQTYSVV